MKKSNFIVSIVLVLLIAISSIACTVEKKNPVTVDTFYEKAASCKCEKVEMEIEDEQVFSLASEAAFASKEREGKVMMCEFYIAKNGANAKKLYSLFKTQSDNVVNGNTEETNVGNYNKFTISNETDTLVVSRVGNTVLVIKADNMFSKCIDKLLNGMEY